MYVVMVTVVVVVVVVKVTSQVGVEQHQTDGHDVAVVEEIHFVC